MRHLGVFDTELLFGRKTCEMMPTAGSTPGAMKRAPEGVDRRIVPKPTATRAFASGRMVTTYQRGDA